MGTAASDEANELRLDFSSLFDDDDLAHSGRLQASANVLRGSLQTPDNLSHSPRSSLFTYRCVRPLLF